MRFQLPFPTSRRVRFAILASLISFGNAGLANAQEPAVNIFDAARTALENQRLSKSEQVGFSITKTAYSDVPANGAVLIGFELQLSKFLKQEIVHALKPIYITEAGMISTKEYGAFGDKVAKKKNSELTRVVRVAAPQGFAVGAITIRRSLYVDSIRLTYHRIKGTSLDTNDAFVSDWVGDNKANSTEKTIGGNGAPIVGIFGNMDERRVLALGVYQLPVAVVALPRLEPQPRNDRPVIVERQPEPERRVAIPERQPVEEPMPPAHGIENPVVAKKDQKAKPKAQDKDQTTWLPIGIFACVMGVVFVSCWLAFGSRFGGQTQRKRGAKKNSLPSDEDDELDEDRPKKRDTLAADLAVAPPSTAVTVKAPYPPVVPSGTFSEKPAVPEVKAPDSHRRGTHVDPVADVPSIAVTQPPYFEARAVYALKINRFYRVYVLPEMLLFLDAGPESGDQYTRGITAAGAVTGGILGAAVGSAIGSAIDYAREDVRYARKRLLDTASTEELIELSAEGGVSFRAAPADLLCARIEPTSTWHTMQYFGNQYIGLLCFQHADQGDVTLELPTPNDMRIALAELPVVFGDQLEVNVALDRRSWQYVSK